MANWAGWADWAGWAVDRVAARWRLREGWNWLAVRCERLVAQHGKTAGRWNSLAAQCEQLVARHGKTAGRWAEAVLGEVLTSVATISAAQREANSVVYEPQPPAGGHVAGRFNSAPSTRSRVEAPALHTLRPQRLFGLAAASGVVLLIVGGLSQPPRPPQPPGPPVPQLVAGPMLRPAAGLVPPPAMPTASVMQTVAESKVPKAQQMRLARSEPTRLEIPAIGVRADLLSLGVDANNEVAVPPLDRAELASWYNLGPSPGELGSAVIVGHVDSEKIGPAVFFNLGLLRPGDAIHVHRRDRTVARFTVDSVRSFPKADFPTEVVYGGHDRVMLRLITCGGEFDKKRKNYLSNVVVFANFAP